MYWNKNIEDIKRERERERIINFLFAQMDVSSNQCNENLIFTLSSRESNVDRDVYFWIILDLKWLFSIAGLRKEVQF